jgi:hypothetical protein
VEPLANSVFWGWQGFKYEADGICFWNATDWTDWDTDAKPGDPYVTAGGRYQGFSMIFYPGSKFGYDGPIASMRLKAMRRGLQDFEYLRLVEAAGRRKHEELVGMADEVKKDYPALRRKLWELAAAK